MEDIFRSRDKCYLCKDIVYDVLPHTKVQLYCTLDLRKYTWGKDENGNSQIKTSNGIMLKNGFDLHRKFLGGIGYGQKIKRMRFALNCSLKTEN